MTLRHFLVQYKLINELSQQNGTKIESLKWLEQSHLKAS